jgi:ubiquinone/menaquinone biosynthesis C-methylase UbiE
LHIVIVGDQSRKLCVYLSLKKEEAPMTSSLSNHGEQKLTPQTLLDMNYAFARTALLIAAVRLHLFTYLSRKPLTSSELAACADVVPAAAERLLRGLEALGLVAREGDAYCLTPITELFLVEGKPSYLGGDTLAMLDYIPAWLELDLTLHTSVPYRDLGDPATAESFFAPRVIDLFPLVFPVAARTAAELPLKMLEEAHILDVGAGSAPWSAAFARAYPSARVTALDLPAVVEQGRQQIAKTGLADRYTWIEADMEAATFPPLTYDLVLCGHVCRFIGDERTKALLTRLAQSLRPGGTILIADVFLSEDKKGPPPAITLDLSMLVNTAQGRIRTAGEIATWLIESGLQDVQQLHVAGPFPVVFARKGEER